MAQVLGRNATFGDEEALTRAEYQTERQDWPDSESRIPTSDLPRGWWRDQAACKGMPSFVFFTQRSVLARKTCEACPVRLPCLAEALEEESRDPAAIFGFRGGMSAAARVRLIRKRNRVPEGTLSA